MSKRSPHDDPLNGIDATKAVVLAGGKPLIPRKMPRCMVHMLAWSGDLTPLRLWECQAWTTHAGIDIVYTHDKQWAFGTWDERATEKFADQPNIGFRLNEASARCTALG
jgi:hypothetical protein